MPLQTVQLRSRPKTHFLWLKVWVAYALKTCKSIWILSWPSSNIAPKAHGFKNSSLIRLLVWLQASYVPTKYMINSVFNVHPPGEFSILAISHWFCQLDNEHGGLLSHGSTIRETKRWCTDDLGLYYFFYGSHLENTTCLSFAFAFKFSYDFWDSNPLGKLYPLRFAILCPALLAQSYETKHTNTWSSKIDWGDGL